MGLYVIPCRTDLQYYSQQLELDGTVYSLTFAWNARDDSWYLSIEDAEGPIAMGLRIVVDTPLLNEVSHPRKPPGILMALDSSQQGQAPRIGELGERVQLMYSEAGV